LFNFMKLYYYKFEIFTKFDQMKNNT